MPVAPITSTVPREPRASRWVTSGIHPDIAGFMPAATARGSAAPVWNAGGSGTASGVASSSATVPHGARGQPV